MCYNESRKKGEYMEKVVPINEIPQSGELRMATNIKGFDSLMGKGLIPGQTIMFAGEPGVGKSTFLLQVSEAIAEQGIPVLYASGEENLPQLRLRADRLGTLNTHILCTNAINLDDIFEAVKSVSPRIIIIDSLQMLYSKSMRQAPGTPTQMRYCLNSMIQFTKENNLILIVVGHSTKTGLVAGLLTLQHMVDTVLFMTIQSENGRRLLTCKKNRFGPAFTGWQLKMTETGLYDLDNNEDLLAGERVVESTESAAFTKGVSNELNGVSEKTRVMSGKQIQELLSNHPFDKFAINSHVQWLAKKLNIRGLTNIDNYDIMLHESK
jgi:DNA repair protein RadA/Sms